MERRNVWLIKRAEYYFFVVGGMGHLCNKFPSHMLCAIVRDESVLISKLYVWGWQSPWFLAAFRWKDRYGTRKSDENSRITYSTPTSQISENQPYYSKNLKSFWFKLLYIESAHVINSIIEENLKNKENLIKKNVL